MSMLVIIWCVHHSSSRFPWQLIKLSTTNGNVAGVRVCNLWVCVSTFVICGNPVAMTTMGVARCPGIIGKFLGRDTWQTRARPTMTSRRKLHIWGMSHYVYYHTADWEKWYKNVVLKCLDWGLGWSRHFFNLLVTVRHLGNLYFEFYA